MPASRRSFLSRALAAGLGYTAARLGLGTTPAGPASQPAVRLAAQQPGFDPWLEVDRTALRHNVSEISRIAGGRPILAVIKNNAYGLGLTTVGPVLDGLAEVAALAVVKADAALELRDAGVGGPILLMARVPHERADELVRRDVLLTPFDDDDPARLGTLARRTGRPVFTHLYIDTGMNRLGMAYHRALPWIERLAAEDGVRVEGTFMGFTEDDAFDREQLERFRRLADDARARGVPLGRLHAASSHALFFRREALLDAVRPGLTLFGAYPAGARERGLADLRTAFRLRARVARVERLRPGDSVSYGRNYVAERPTWIATLPVGHADGYPRAAVDGCEVLIGGRAYPVIGAVSASHTIVEIGDERRVAVGDPATLVGPDDPAVLPNTVAERAGISVYDVLMHLSSRLPVSSPSV